MSNLEITYGNFQVKGMAVGLLNSNAFNEGEKQGGNHWRRLNFGVKVCENGFVYMELMAAKTPKVKLVQRDSITRKLKKENSILVSWDDRYSKTDNGYELYMPIKLNFDFNSTMEADEKLHPYDAIEHVKDNVHEGDYVYAHGSLQIAEYQGKPQEKFLLQGIYKLSDNINLESQPQAYFSHEIVFNNLDIDYQNKKCNINTYIVYRKDDSIHFAPYVFVTRSRDVYKYFSYEVPYGSTIKVHGKINQYVPLNLEDKKQPYIMGVAVRELEILGGDVKSLVRERYKEQDFIQTEDMFKTESKEESEDDSPF